MNRAFLEVDDYHRLVIDILNLDRFENSTRFHLAIVTFQSLHIVPSGHYERFSLVFHILVNLRLIGLRCQDLPYNQQFCCEEIPF